MKWAAIVVGALVALLLLLVLESAIAKQTAGHAMPLTIAGPPPQPCVFPDVSELATMARDSDAVVEGSVGSAEPLYYGGISQAFTRYRVHVQSVLRQKAPTSTTLLIDEAGGVPVPIFQPGSYILFLQRAGSNYFAVNGLYGTFPVRAGAVYRECPNYQAPAKMIEASGAGQGMPLLDFAAEVESLPAIAPPPHK